MTLLTVRNLDKRFGGLHAVKRISMEVEKGEIVGPIQDLRFDDTLYNIWGDQLLGLTKSQQIFTNTSTYNKREKGGMKVPGALLREFNFTL